MRAPTPRARLAPVTTSLLWLRRDLRLSDFPALLEARDAADEVLAVFVLDPRLIKPAGAPRVAFLLRCLRELSDRMDDRLCVVRGDPVRLIPRLAREHSAMSVHLSADFGPYGRERDATVEQALAKDKRQLLRAGSAYAVSPGRLCKDDGTPYQVFSAFRRAWGQHGWRDPAATTRTLAWAEPDTKARIAIPADPSLGKTTLPTAGEPAARARMRQFLSQAVTGYDKQRNEPAADATSRLSPYLKYGCLHPRTVLHELAKAGTGTGIETFRNELCWREFYADVLWRRPDSARRALQERMRDIQVDEGETADRRFQAWAEGRTGYPIVDAGMRQLLAEGWMHNRVRMIVASFLVKDLHVDWQRGARYFLQHLVDGDLASNHHGWQWVAGTGTDPAPYFRIFNPTTQGEKFDADGDYVRRYVPELRHLQGKAVHQPWALEQPPAGYPAPIVDHKRERAEALRRYEQLRR
jgi:deoxyribodipyrimidine photo-lyase